MAAPPTAIGSSIARARRTRLRALQRHVGRFYQPEIMAPASRCSTTTTTATSTSTSCRDGCSDRGTPLLPPPAGHRSRIGCTATTSSCRPTARASLRFTDVTAAQRHRHARIRHGRRRRRHRQRRLHRSVSARASTAISCSTTTGTGRSRTSPTRIGHRRSGVVGRVGGVRRLRPRRLARPVRRQLPELLAADARRAVSVRPVRRDYCRPEVLPRAAKPPVSQQRQTARSPT